MGQAVQPEADDVTEKVVDGWQPRVSKRGPHRTRRLAKELLDSPVDPVGVPSGHGDSHPTVAELAREARVAADPDAETRSDPLTDDVGSLGVGQPGVVTSGDSDEGEQWTRLLSSEGVVVGDIATHLGTLFSADEFASFNRVASWVGDLLALGYGNRCPGAGVRCAGCGCGHPPAVVPSVSLTLGDAVYALEGDSGPQWNVVRTIDAELGEVAGRWEVRLRPRMAAQSEPELEL